MKTKTYISRWVANKGWKDSLEKRKSECLEDTKGDIIYVIAIPKDCYAKTLAWLGQEGALILTSEEIAKPVIRVENLGYGNKETSLIKCPEKGSIGYMIKFLVKPSTDEKVKTKYSTEIKNYSCFSEYHKLMDHYIKYYVHNNKSLVEREFHH